MATAIQCTFVGYTDSGDMMMKPVEPAEPPRPADFIPSHDEAWKIYVALCESNKQAQTSNEKLAEMSEMLQRVSVASVVSAEAAEAAAADAQKWKQLYHASVAKI